MFGLFKKTNKPKRAASEDDDYNLEWRNKYLTARLKFLIKKIEKRNGIIGVVTTGETELKAVNLFLASTVERLEAEYKQIK
ncbi:MAG: hypothetical protein ABJ275_09365 [Maricaulaceae bacterium]